MKTHKVIDLIYHEDENNFAFVGTYDECIEFKINNGFGLQILPLTKEEKQIYNEE